MTVTWDKTLLVGDVGGTNARFALAHMVEGKPVLEHHESFPAERYPTFLGGVKAFIDGCEVKPTGGVIAVAGPVTDGEIDLTNSPWAVSEKELGDAGTQSRAADQRLRGPGLGRAGGAVRPAGFAGRSRRG
jgi:glucokinase